MKPKKDELKPAKPKKIFKRCGSPNPKGHACQLQRGHYGAHQ
jgi:hypothetical protein